MTIHLTPDICVIGAGSAGLSVAAAAAAFGVEVVLIERDLMGGDCLNTGCVPSKALLASAKMAHMPMISDQLGITLGPSAVDFAAVNDHVQSVIAAIAPHDSVERFEGLGVKVIQSEARFTGPDVVVAGDYEVRARRFVVATGSSPAIPGIPGLSSVPVLTNETLFELREVPWHLIIIGGGPIGMEMAQAHRRLGAKVTVVEAQTALGKDDPEFAAIVVEALREDGVDILENTAVHSVEREDGNVAVILDYGNGESERLVGSHVLAATGRKPSVDGIGLDKAGVGFDAKGVKVGADFRTSNKRVYAIGDVTGGLQFTHAAGYQAGLLIRTLLFRLPVTYRPQNMPWVTYTSPELGHVGLSEADARQKHGRKVRVLTADYAGNDRAQAEGQTRGRVKLIAGPGGRLLGAEVVGTQAGELINLLSLALSKKMKMKDLAGFVAPYPTLGELVRRAAISYYADMPRKPWVRRVLGVLRKLG